MHPILISFWKITIYSHGVMVALGMILGGYLIYYLVKQEGLQTNKLLDLFLYAVIAGLIGARLNYVIFYSGYFDNFWEYFAVWQGGMVSYGGILAGFGVAIWFLRKWKQNIWKWLDIGIIGFMLGWGIGRVGCLLAGDVVGRPTDFVLGVISPAIDSVSRHPVAGYESFASLVIFAILILIYNVRALKDGLLFFIGFIFYFVVRFGIEFSREYSSAFWGLSDSQLVLVGLFLIAIGGFVFRYRTR